MECFLPGLAHDGSKPTDSFVTKNMRRSARRAVSQCGLGVSPSRATDVSEAIARNERRTRASPEGREKLFSSLFESHVFKRGIIAAFCPLPSAFLLLSWRSSRLQPFGHALRVGGASRREGGSLK